MATQIMSREEFDSFSNSEIFASSKLSEIDAADRAFFRQSLDFDDDGKLTSAFLGDLVEKYSFSDDDLSEVLALFGVSRERLFAKYHYFGDGQGNCLPRQFWYCGHE